MVGAQRCSNTVCVLAGSLKDIHSVVRKPFLCCLCCVFLRVLRSRLSSRLCTLLHSSIVHCSSLTDGSFLLLRNIPQHDAATTVLYSTNNISQIMSITWFPPDMPLGIQTKELNFGQKTLERLSDHEKRNSLQVGH